MLIVNENTMLHQYKNLLIIKLDTYEKYFFSC